MIEDRIETRYKILALKTKIMVFNGQFLKACAIKTQNGLKQNKIQQKILWHFMTLKKHRLPQLEGKKNFLRGSHFFMYSSRAVT